MNETNGLGILISIGKWGGVYIAKGQGLRIAIGWIAFTLYPFDGDVLLHAAAYGSDEYRKWKVKRLA
jgi:hypothetical protein